MHSEGGVIGQGSVFGQQTPSHVPSGLSWPQHFWTWKKHVPAAATTAAAVSSPVLLYPPYSLADLYNDASAVNPGTFIVFISHLLLVGHTIPLLRPRRERPHRRAASPSSVMNWRRLIGPLIEGYLSGIVFLLRKLSPDLVTKGSGGSGLSCARSSTALMNLTPRMIFGNRDGHSGDAGPIAISSGRHGPDGREPVKRHLARTSVQSRVEEPGSNRSCRRQIRGTDKHRAQNTWPWHPATYADTAGSSRGIHFVRIDATE